MRRPPPASACGPAASARRRALAQARWAVIRAASAECVDREEAARRAGLKPASLETMLYRRTGSTTWPLSEGAGR